MPVLISNSRSRLVVLVGLSMAIAAVAEEPAPPWNPVLKSELVVAGRYKSHNNGVLSLQVDEVLRGKTCKAGDTLPVKLAPAIGFKFYVTETVKGNLVSLDKFFATNDTLHNPRMLFIDEIDKQVHETLITYNAEIPHIYFFAKESPALLDRPIQVQADRRRGWKRILDGKRDLAFEMLYAPGYEVSSKAVAEVFKTRDREAIVGLLEGLLEPSRAHPSSVRTPEFAERVLRSLGDKDGDVYGPALKALSSELGGSYDHAFRLARILARADSKRALADFKKLLQPGSRISTDGILVSLHHLESEEGLDLMFEWMKEGRVQAYYSFEEMMFNRYPSGATQMVKRARLQELAVPRLKKALKDRAFPDDVHTVAMFYANFRFLVEEPPPNEISRNGPGFDHVNRCPRRNGFPEWDRLEYESQGDLEQILRADLVEGRKRLSDRMGNAPKAGPDGQFELEILNYLAHRYGDADMVKTFTKPPEPIVRFMETDAARFHRVTLSHYLKLFDKSPKLIRDYWPQMAALFPAHTDIFFREIHALLVSENKSLREFAIYQLKDRFLWDFGFDADDYPFVNRQKLEALKPLFDRFSQSKDILEMRGILLQHFGIKLEGRPGRSWLPALETAVLRWNPIIHLNALCMLGMIEEDTEIMRFAGYPLSVRQKELEAHRKQRRAKRNDAQWKPDQFEAPWKDLDKDRATSYAAMQALLKGRESTVAWLGKQLKQPRRDAVRDVRAIQVLEYLSIPEARTLLEELAAGPGGSPITHEAKGALERLGRFWRW